MDKHSIELLQECNSGEKMAISSMNQVLGFVKDEKLRNVIDKYKRKHEELERECEKLLAECKEEGKEPGIVATAFSTISTNIKLALNEDDSKIAEIMMDGCNMGIKSVCKYQNECLEVSKESKSHAEQLVRTEEEFMKELKSFV